MHEADLKHNNSFLQEKLQTLYDLRRTRSAVNWDRDGFADLLDKFGNPHLRMPPVIHVAGTNGKGSIIAMLRAMLEASGKKVHVYTSPHLVHVNERIVLAGQQIRDDYLEELIDRALKYNDGSPLSFFEITTAIAFEAFSKTPADILLLEVGMGGRLDCTNVIEAPLVSIINKISLDHTEFLGDTIEDIAAEKAGIIKAGIPCVVGYQGCDVSSKTIIETIRSVSRPLLSPLYEYDVGWSVSTCSDGINFSLGSEEYRFPAPSLLGDHQVKNAGAALCALFLVSDDLGLSRDAMAKGLVNINWPGRLQKLPSEKFYAQSTAEIYLDTGHNDSAGQALANQADLWETEDNRQLHMVVGILGRKDISAFLKPLQSKIKSLNIVPISSDPTAQKIDDIRHALENSNVVIDNIYSYDKIIEAIEAIISKDKNARILIAGSVYLAGEVLGYLECLD